MLHRSVFVGAAGGVGSRSCFARRMEAGKEEDFHLDGLGAGWKETLLGIKRRQGRINECKGAMERNAFKNLREAFVDR